MAQPTQKANIAARERLVGPFYDEAATASARARAQQLMDVIPQLTNPGQVPTHLQPSLHPFSNAVATRTGLVNGARVPSMYYNIEPERKIAQALSSAKAEQEIVRAALAMFAPTPYQVTPAISGPHRQPAVPRGGAAGPAMALLELLTYSGGLNEGEDAELEKRRTAGTEQLIRQVLSLGGKTTGEK